MTTNRKNKDDSTKRKSTKQNSIEGNSIKRDSNLNKPISASQNLDPNNIAKEIGKLLQKLLTIYKTEPLYHYPVDLLHYSHFYENFYKILLDISMDPLKTIKIQEDYLNETFSLFLANINEPLGNHKTKENLKIKIPEDDRRFSDPLWEKEPFFKNLKDTYYLLTEYSLKWLRSLSTIDKKTRQQLHFYIKNILDLLSPSNYIQTNPQVLQATLLQSGENYLAGTKNLLQDLVLNKGRFNISKTDINAFKVGQNLAITPGKIVFQNDLMQLIQYSPQTKEVHEIPILFIPPWINKYYVLDLSPENSLVRWLVLQGFSVFMISWVNPDERLMNKEFADYMFEGPLQALEIICNHLKVNEVHLVGYCIGGTLLACTLSYMAKMNDKRAKSATYFMSLIDFSNPGELGVFIDEPQLEMLDNIMKEKGYLDGRLLDMTFNFLRPNDLVWPYYINNYLLGKPPRPFDLLYWNADSSNLSYKMYSFYLRQFYLKNNLRKPSKIKLADVPIDLNDIDVPTFCLASETDHISLWRSVYTGAKLFKCPVRFVLTESGHVRGVINPPPSTKYNFYTNEKLGYEKPLPTIAKDWRMQARKYEGSWWPYWAKWLQELGLSSQSRPQAENQSNLERKLSVWVAAQTRDPSLSPNQVLEDAPGSYVLRRL